MTKGRSYPQQRVREVFYFYLLNIGGASTSFYQFNSNPALRFPHEYMFKLSELKRRVCAKRVDVVKC